MSITLSVKEAKKRDEGRNIVRIDSKVMNKLNIRTGDVLMITGDKVSAGIAWKAYPQDKGLEIARLDSRLRENSGANIDDTIEIQKINPNVAQMIVLTPISMSIDSNQEIESYIKKRFNNYPITLDDIINILIEINTDINFRVIGITPKGVCIIKKKTMIKIHKNTVTN